MNASLIALTHNRDQNLKLFLECMKNQTVKKFELNVFESANILNSIEILKNYQDYFKINCWQQHMKYVDKTKTLNFLANNSKNEVLIICDIDILKPENFVESMLEKISENKFIVQLCKKLDFNLTQLYLKNFKTYKDLNLKEQKTEIWKGAISQTTVLKEKFLEIGGYNEEFFGSGYEDSDLFRRLSEILQLEYDSEFGYHLFHGTRNTFEINPLRANNKEIFHKNINKIVIKNNVNRTFNLQKTDSKILKVI